MLNLFILLQLVDQIVVTAEVEARSRNEIFGDSNRSDSNLIQNALKYTHAEGKVQVRAIWWESTLWLKWRMNAVVCCLIPRKTILSRRGPTGAQWKNRPRT
jgi:hypothetical protein